MPVCYSCFVFCVKCFQSRSQSLIVIGNVSYVVPTIHSMFAIPAPEGAYPHHPTFQSCAGTDEAHAEAVLVGKVLALVGWDILTDDSLYATARKEWQDDISKASV